MTRKRSSPMGLEIYLPVLLAFVMLPLLAQAAPLQDYTEIQQYTEGCYYNYNHYNEGDRILTNEPCLNCTCHNKMLMCYLRVCPFTKPIGHDCIVEKREDQCCPIVTCPEVPVDVAHAAPEPGTELSFPEKFGCSIDGKFYLEGAQVPSNPNKPCELCYCIKNRTSCLMQECTLHIDGCTPIYNKGSCCPVRYNCDHENDVLELEDHSTTTEAATTTTERPTTGFIIASTMSPSVSTDCVHNGKLYADGARIRGETACENCYCMRGDIICAVQECHMPMLNSNGKSCHALPAAEGECCPSNYICEDDSSTTQIIEASTLPYDGIEEDIKVTTANPVKDLHSGIPEEDLQLQTHIDEEEIATKAPATESETEEEAKTEGAEKESVTKETENVEGTTTASSVVSESTESDDSLSKIENDTKTEGPDTGMSEAPIGKDQVEETSATAAPNAADELPGISIDATTASAEEDAKEISTEKPDIGEFVTTSPATDDEKTQEVTSEPTENEAKPIAGDEYVTLSPSSDEELSITKATFVEKEEHKPEESYEDVTKDSLDIEKTTGVFQETSTKTPMALEEQETEQTTETSEKSGEEEQEVSIEGSGEETYDQSAETPTAEKEKEPPLIVTEEVPTVTTVVPERVSVEGDEEMSSERPKESPKPEDEEHAAGTESDEGTKVQSADELSTSVPAIEEQSTVSIDMSTESEQSEIVSEIPVSADEEQVFVTTSSDIEEDKKQGESMVTEVPTLVPSVSTEKEIQVPTDTSADKEDQEGSGQDEPLSTDKQEIDRITETPKKDHTVTPTQFEHEFGSGDHSTDVSSADEVTSESSVIATSTESVTTPEYQDEEYTTSHVSNEERLGEGKEPMNTEISKEPDESEEDSKLIELTTAKLSEEHIDTTTKTPAVDTTTSAAKTSEEVSEKESEISKTDDKVETEELQTEKPAEFEETTTQNTIDGSEDTTAMPTGDTVHEKEEDHHKILPESDGHTAEQPSETTDSPMVIIEDTEAQTESEADKKHEIESTSTVSTKSEEEPASTTVKPFLEPTYVEEMPDMQLPSVIPGEGDCLVGQKTYQNNTVVPTSDECEVVCKCVSSIVSCERVSCDVPENIENCVLDERSTNKCCPSYICGIDNLPSVIEDSVESTEEDEDEEIPYTTIATPHKISEQPTVVEETEEKSEVTTVKPSVTAEGVVPGIIIPEIEMPIASTEEPMSHVKDEEEQFEPEGTKGSVNASAEDKKDVYDDSEVHTTPSAVVEDNVLPQSMAPVQSSEQEQQHIVTDKVPVESAEKEITPEFSGDQQPENVQFEETTTGFVQSVTDSSTEPDMLSSNEYQTVKPIGKHEQEEASQEANTTPAYGKDKDSETKKQTISPISSSGDESAEQVPSAEKETEPSSHTAMPTTSTEKETAAEDETKIHGAVPPVPSEQDKVSAAPEEHTAIPVTSTESNDKKISQDAENQTVPIDLEKESQTSKPMDTTIPSSSETTVAPVGEKQDENSQEIETSTSASTKDIEKEEQEHLSTTESLENVSDSTAGSVSSKAPEYEGDITHTTDLSSMVDTEDDGSPSEQTVAPSLQKEESTESLESTSSSPVSEEEKEEHTGITPQEYEKDTSATTASTLSPISEIEHSTYIPGAKDEIMESVTTLEDEYLESTVVPTAQNELKETSDETISETSTSEAPVRESEEDKTHVLIPEEHHITPTSDKSVSESDERDIQTTDRPISEQTSTEAIDIATEKPTDFETKIDTSSIPIMDEEQTSILPQEDVSEHTSTTVSAADEKTESGKDSEEDYTQTSPTDKSGQEQTESTPLDHEQGSTVRPSSDKTVSALDEVTPLFEDRDEENITIPSIDESEEEVKQFTTTVVSPTQEEKENVTKHPIISDVHKPQEDIDNVTTETTISSTSTEEISTDMVPTEEDKPDKQKPVPLAEEFTTSAPDIQQQSTHAPSKQPSLDLSEEASGESEESEEEISSEPTKIKNVDEFVTERTGDTTDKPSEMETSTEMEKEASGEEDEMEKELPSTTEKSYQPTDKEIEPITKPEGFEVSADKLPEDKISHPVFEAPDDTTDENVTAQQPQESVPSSTKSPVAEDFTTQQPEEQNLLDASVTKATLGEQEIEGTSTQEPESVTTAPQSAEDTHYITTNQPEAEKEISVEERTTEKPEVEVVSSEQPVAEGMEDSTEGEADISSVTKSPIAKEDITIQNLEDEDTVAVTNAPGSIEEVETVSAKQPEKEKEKDDLEHVTHSTKHPEESDVITDVTKSPIAADEIQNVTAEEEENISYTTQTSIAPVEAANVTAKPDNISEEFDLATDKLPTEEMVDHIEEHISQVPQEEGMETTTLKSQISETTDEVKPSKETDETLSTTERLQTFEEAETTTKFPIAQQADELFDTTAATKVESEFEEEDKPSLPTISDQEEPVESITAKLPELAEHITESPAKDTETKETEEKSHEYSTELPIVPHIPIEVSEPGKKEEHTEVPIRTHEEHKPAEHFATDVSANETESVEKDGDELAEKFPEAEKESHADATDFPAGTDTTKKLPEDVSEIPVIDLDSEDEREHGDETTPVSLEASQPTETGDHVTDIPEKGAELPIDEHVSADKLPEHITESEEESSELPVSSEQATELPAKDTEQEENIKAHEETTDKPTGVDISTIKLPETPEHVTEFSTESAVPEIAERITELPIEDTEEEDKEEKSQEKSTESPEHFTEMPAKDTKSETPETTDKSFELSQENVTESKADKEESPKEVTELPSVGSVSTDKVHEIVTELPPKEMESEEKPHEVHVDAQEIPTKYLPDTKTEDEVTELPSETYGLPELEGHGADIPTKDVKTEQDTELPVVVAHDVSTVEQALDQSTETISKEEEEESYEETTSSETADEITDDKLLPATTAHPLFPHITTTLPTVAIDGRIDDTNLTFAAHSTAAPATPTTPSTSTTTSEPITTAAPHHYQPQPPIYGQPPQYGPTQYEDEYTDEDEGEVFGPGTCRYGGKLYVSAQQIPRDDPCDFCFCFRSDIICLQQSCPPPIAGCHEEPISGFCCPRYECPVSMATVLNITTSTTTTSTTLPPHFLHHSYGNNVQRNGCLINGRSYRVGEKIESTSGPCINCTCGGDGKMKCDPQACVPEPTMQQVMAVVAAGRKR